MDDPQLKELDARQRELEAMRVVYDAIKDFDLTARRRIMAFAVGVSVAPGMSAESPGGQSVRTGVVKRVRDWIDARPAGALFDYADVGEALPDDDIQSIRAIVGRVARGGKIERVTNGTYRKL